MRGEVALLVRWVPHEPPTEVDDGRVSTETGPSSLHRRALDAVRPLLAGLTAADLTRPTPCSAWDLQQLLAHVVGQNRGFAEAVARGDAPPDSYRPVLLATAAEVLRAWDRSSEALTTAFRSAPPDHLVHLVEVRPGSPVPAATAQRIHLLDTVVHTWDVASSLGLPHRPEDDLLEAVAAVALLIPAGASRRVAGAAFAPAVPSASTDAWALTLAALGRGGPGD